MGTTNNEVKATETTAAPAVVPPAKFIAMGNTAEEFAIAVARQMLENGLFTVHPSKNGEKKFAKFALGGVGDPRKDMYASLPLSPEQSEKLPFTQGVPTDLAFQVTGLNLVPPASLKRHAAERVVELEESESRLEARLAQIRAQKEAATARRS